MEQCKAKDQDFKSYANTVLVAAVVCLQVWGQDF
jgi:hypothetical protein